VIQKGQQGKINIHLGFLQVKHRYRVELNIPLTILDEFKTPEHQLMLKVDDNDVPNINCKLLTFKGDTEQSQFYEAEIEFFAHKEKLLKEEMKLVTNDGKHVKFVFSARVLGRGKGTPMLKSGVHLLGIEDDDESGELCNCRRWHNDDSLTFPSLQMHQTGKDFPARNATNCRPIKLSKNTFNKC
jgi:hypothetical protein